MTSSAIGGIYRVMEWITRLVWINVLWLGFTLLGLIAAGIGPATAALFAVTRKWAMGQTDVPVFKTFAQAYKKEFWSANVLMLLLAAIGYFLIADYRYFQDHAVLRIGTLLLLSGYAVIAAYAWPVFAHYAASPVKVLKLSLIIGFTRPFRTLSMLAVVVSLAVVMMCLPRLVPFFGVSLAGALLSVLAHQAFPKAE